MFRSVSSRPTLGVHWRVLAATALCLSFLVNGSFAARVAHAAPVTTPCATDSNGIPVSFDSPDHPYLCTITRTDNPDGSEDVRIDQPDVTDISGLEYKSIVFHPGDLVTITADGCVQTAGFGTATWKKYVNPSGPNSPSDPPIGEPNGLYWGNVTIPGATYAKGPLQQTSLDNLTSPDTTPPAPIFIPSVNSYPGHRIDLTLGYVDDQYTDFGGNGYWNHDNGDNDQCANTDPNLKAAELAGTAPLGQYGGPAWIDLHIVHNQSNPFGNVPPQDWDLVPNGLDPNGLPYNPEWGWQINGGTIANQGIYVPGQPPLGKVDTQQNTVYDPPPSSFFNFFSLCDFGGSGHNNWFDVTYSAPVSWVEHANATVGDDDYNMKIATPIFHTDPAGTTFDNQQHSSLDDTKEQDIGLEFNASETIDNFDQSLFWKTFHQTVDNFGDAAAGNIINGHDAIVVGLMGIDEMHNPHSEIHPVHALAIRESAPGSPNLSNDTWAIFVRNWGDEGKCSSNQHYLLDNQITLDLPPPIPSSFPGLIATKNADTQLFNQGGDGKSSFYSGPEGTFITFDLPPADSQGYWFGELDLNWSSGHMMAYSARAAAAGAAAHRAWLHTLLARALKHAHHSHHARLVPHISLADPSTEDPEQLMTDIYDSLSPAQQQSYQNLLHILLPPQPPIVSTPGQVQILSSPPQRPATIPGVATAPATAKLQRDEAQERSFCAATGGNVPIIPTTACAALSFPPVTTLSTSGGPPVANGWSTTPVTATLTAHDGSGSGIAFTQYSYDGQKWTNYTGPFTLPDGAYTFYYRSQDNKGNLEEIRQRAFKIDTAPPIITINQPQATNYTHSSALTLDYSVVDGNGQSTGVGAGSGVQSFTPTIDGATTLAGHGLASGQAINLLTELSLGSHTFSVNSVDNVGHANSKSVTFSIIVTPDSIIGDVNQFFGAGKITQDDAQSLLAKLQAAKKARAAGDCANAASIYQSFISVVQAQSGNHIDPTASAIMIADAQYLIAHCP